MGAPVAATNRRGHGVQPFRTYPETLRIAVNVCCVSCVSPGVLACALVSWEVDDARGERVQPLTPPAPSRSKGGRPRVDDRRWFAAIVYVLRTGAQWNAIPKEICSRQCCPRSISRLGAGWLLPRTVEDRPDGVRRGAWDRLGMAISGRSDDQVPFWRRRDGGKSHGSRQGGGEEKPADRRRRNPAGPVR